MEIYEAPKIEVIQFDNDDVIVTSVVCGSGSETMDTNGG